MQLTTDDLIEQRSVFRRDVPLRLVNGAGAVKTGRQPNRPRFRPVALPVEHGGWGFSLEPVVLGLLVAPSLAGLFLAMATMGAFLARHPLKLAMADYRRGRRLPRTPIAERFVLLYLSIAALCLVAAFQVAARFEFALPLLMAAPLALVQLLHDRSGHSRALPAELAGATAIGATAAAIALAAGWPVTLAFGLWGVLVARFVPAIIYVRARLRMLHGRPCSPATAMIAHALATAFAVGLAWFRIVPASAAFALLILAARAIYGFSARNRAATARRIGIRELVYGAMTVVVVAIGYYLTPVS